MHLLRFLAPVQVLAGIALFCIKVLAKSNDKIVGLAYWRNERRLLRAIFDKVTRSWQPSLAADKHIGANAAVVVHLSVPGWYLQKRATNTVL